VHPTTLGGSEDYATVVPKIERTSRGVKVTRWTINTEAPGFIQKVRPFPGRVDRWNIYDFVMPGVLLMDSGMALTGTGAPEGRRVDAAEFRGCQALTPETANSTHYFFAHPHNFLMAMDSGFKMVSLGIDSALSQFRWMVNKQIDAEAKSDASA
jgi:vanillate O-demethylase monooxygenase subunit